MKSLLMWLEGPLQSWGVDSRFDRRETLPFPTLSGVCGLLCAALGAEGEQKALLAEMTKAGWKVQSFLPTDASAPEVLRDFHMIGGGYDSTDPWLNLFIPKKIDGKAPTGASGVKLTYRYMLQSQAFAVILTYDDEVMAEKLNAALQRPVWTLFLGRRHCAPTEIIGQGLFDTVEEAEERAASLAKSKGRSLAFEVVEGKQKVEVDGKEVDAGEFLALNDVPVCFGLHKIYRDRYVTLIRPEEA